MLTELSICTHALFIIAYTNDLSFTQSASFDLMAILLCLRGIVFIYNLTINWLCGEINEHDIYVFGTLLLIDMWLSTVYNSAKIDAHN